ncbi:MAG: GMC family oxidoreductase [Gemmatimonadaceae bacterium]|nr:GMC family oxidoreductase [Gemmatimonadaceae bacterium]
MADHTGFVSLGTRQPRERRRFDAIVVGSGIAGGWAAKELCERGLETLVLEAGGPIAADGSDYVEHIQAYDMKFRGWGDRQDMARTQPIQRDCYACSETGRKFFVNDLENPYTTPPDARFNWFRGRQVGGRSITWGRQVYRWSDLDFEANARDGHGTDWPIRYADLAPWYTHVERFIGVTGAAEGLAQLPDGDFLPPMELNAAERLGRERLARAFGGTRVLTIGRAAILTRAHRGRAACHYCGPCERGCVTHSYFSSIGSTLPAARATGRLTLRPHSVAAEVLVDPATGRARGVRVIDARTMEEHVFEARVVFVCASAIESVRLLLNSRSLRHPDGLANSSGTLGRYVMDHHFGGGASGTMPGLLDRRTRGARPNGTYIARFRNLAGGPASKDFLRGYGLQGGAGRGGWGRGGGMPGWGADFKQRRSRTPTTGSRSTPRCVTSGASPPRASRCAGARTNSRCTATLWRARWRCSTRWAVPTSAPTARSTRRATASTRWAARAWRAPPRTACSTGGTARGTSPTST